MKNYYTSAKTISKNQFFKDRVILNPGELKEKLSSVHENEKEAFYFQKFNDLFDENKFKIRNDFDSEHSKEFLEEKEKYLQPINLDNTFSEDDDDNSEVLNRISSKFTFGHY